MRTIRETKSFSKDLKRVRKDSFHQNIDFLLAQVLTLLINDLPLPAKLRDHALKGKFHNLRDCHLKPNLILLYRKIGSQFLELIRLGSHSEIFSES